MEDSIKINLPVGKYVVAVSGGVDSVVLLELLAAQPELELVVAHFDHGIRDDSSADAELVRALAQKHGLEYATASGNLGPDTSEAAARAARYAFLNSVVKKHQAKAMVLAHHQDDILETILINLHRGSGWRGVAALRDETNRRRPLLNHSKQQLKDFALRNNLIWREDKTNQDMRFLRNRIRQEILPKLSSKQRQKLLALRHRQIILKALIETELSLLTTKSYLEIDRYLLIMWPKPVAMEYLQNLIKNLSGQCLLTSQAELLLHFARSARSGKVYRPRAGLEFIANRDKIIAKLGSKLVS